MPEADAQHRDAVVPTQELSVSGNGVFIPVSGTFNMDDTFEAEGVGIAAGFPNTKVELNGKFTREGGMVVGFEADYDVGTTGNLPGGQSALYRAIAKYQGN